MNMKTTHIHKITGKKLHRIKKHGKVSLYYVIGETMPMFMSKRRVPRKAICKKENVKKVKN